MDNFASELIDALGGTSQVAELMGAPVSTVHNMRVRHLTGSRLNHLLRIAAVEHPNFDVGALAARHNITLPAGLSIGPASEAALAESVSV